MAPSLAQACSSLQQCFNRLQVVFSSLRLVLNANKTKVMHFTKSRSSLTPTSLNISTLEGKCIEKVSAYKYLGIWIDEKLTFKVHIENLVRKLRVKLGFYFRNRSCFSLQARKRLINATFLPVLDYGDVIYMHAASSILQTLDTVYHGALRFILNVKSRTHHCCLYEMAGLSSLALRRWIHWHIFIYKAIISKLPIYLTNLLTRNNSTYNLRSNDSLLLTVPRTKTELGKTAFNHSAPSYWNRLQKDMKLNIFISLRHFKQLLTNLKSECCTCFK